jgi:DNA-binding SARP family transcriptional activator
MAARLTRFLVARAGEPVSEDELLDTFWPDKDAQAAKRSLQVYLSHARGVLDAPGAAESCLHAAGRAYVLRLDPADVVDASRFETAAAHALGGDDPDRLETVAALWTGEPMPEERYSDWAAGYRERLVDRYVELLAALSAARRRRGDHRGWIDAGRRMLAADPVNERAHRDLMLAYATAGRVGHALRQFLECRRLLVDDLGVEPGHETVALHARILAGAPLSDR